MSEDMTGSIAATQVPVEPHDNAPSPAESSTPKQEPKLEVKKPDLDTAIQTAYAKAKADADAKDVAKGVTPKVDPEGTKKPEVEAKPDPKPAETAEAKAQRQREADGKFAPREPKEPSAPAESADGSGQEVKADARPSEGRDYTKPPAHFLPRAKEAWGGVNPDVQGEVHRMAQNYEKGIAEYKESHENWSKLKEFDQMAKQAGTTVPDYIRNVRAIETLIAQNPVEGIKRVLATANITPEQYARHILGQQQEQQANPQAAQNGQLIQTIQELTQKIQGIEMRDAQREEEARLNAIADKFVAPFKAEHDRFDELEEDIAFFLNSGKIQFNLSEQDRLAAAYDMAERINPAPKFIANPEPGTQATPRPLNTAGLKSVTGSPTPGLATTRAPSKEDAKDLDGALRRAFAKATATAR